MEICKITKSKCIPGSIDGCSDPAGISQLFAKKYEPLYNSVGYDADDLSSIQVKVETQVNESCLEQALFGKDDMKKAIGMLKHNKHDGNIGLYSDNIIYGTDKLFSLLVKYLMVC